MASTQPILSAEETFDMARAIAIAKNKTTELKALAASFALAVIVFDLVSLLIGGVIRPLHPEW